MCQELCLCCGALAGSSLGVWAGGAECPPDQRKPWFTSILGKQELPRLVLPQEIAAKLQLGCLNSDLEERFCVNQTCEVFPIEMSERDADQGISVMWATWGSCPEGQGSSGAAPRV